MVLDDILELAESPEYVSFFFTMIINMNMNMNINMNINIIKNTFIFRYASHPKQQPGELVGFTVPEWMIEKMKVDYFVSVSVPVPVPVSIVVSVVVSVSASLENARSLRYIIFAGLHRDGKDKP